MFDRLQKIQIARKLERIERAIQADARTAVRKPSEILVVEQLIADSNDESFRDLARSALRDFQRAVPGVADSVATSLARQLSFANTSTVDTERILEELQIMQNGSGEIGSPAMIGSPAREYGFSSEFKIKVNADLILKQLNHNRKSRVTENAARLSRRLELRPDTVEKELLTFLKTKRDQYAGGAALYSLKFVGGPASIPTLRRFALKAKSVEEACSAIAALGEIAGPSAQDVYMHALEKRANFHFKQLGLQLMLRHGDGRAIKAARERVKKILAKPTYSGRLSPLSYAGNPGLQPELVDALCYLRKHAPDEESELLGWIVWSKRRDYLDEAERGYVLARTRELGLAGSA